jgi:hypothetical protein
MGHAVSADGPVLPVPGAIGAGPWGHDLALGGSASEYEIAGTG